MFEKRGCQVVLGLIGLALAIGLLLPGTCQGGMGGPPPVEEAKVATVAGREISYADLAARVEEARRNRRQTDPSTQFTTGIQALDGVISEAALASLASTKGVTLSDEQAVKLFEAENQNSLAEVKLQLVQQGLVKPGADDKAYDEAFKKLRGVTLTEAQAQALADFKAALSDPGRKFQARQSVLGLAVRDRYRADAKDTLEDLKKSFRKYKVLRIPFDDLKLDYEARKESAEAAAQELKRGAKAEAVMAKYAPKAPKDPMELDQSILEGQPGMEEIARLKPGESTGVLDQFGTPVVYYLVSTSPGLPADFEKSKDMRLKLFREREADKRLQKDIAALKDPAKIEWGDPALGLAYEAWALMSGASGTDPKDRRAKLKEIAARAETVEAKTPLGSALAGLAGYAAFENYYMQLNPDQQAEERPARIAKLRKALEDTEDFNMRLSLYDMLLEEGEFEEATLALKQAAAAVYGFEQQDQLNLGEVQRRLAAAEKNPKVKKEWLQGTKDELARWAKDRAKFEQEERELEAERKKAAAEDAKREAEEKAKLEAEKKAAAKDKPGG